MQVTRFSFQCKYNLIPISLSSNDVCRIVDTLADTPLHIVDGEAPQLLDHSLHEILENLSPTLSSFAGSRVNRWLCNTCPSDICPHLFWDICPHYFGTFAPTYFGHLPLGHLPLGHLLPHILGHLHPPIIKSESVGFLRQVANPPPSSLLETRSTRWWTRCWTRIWPRSSTRRWSRSCVKIHT